MSKSPANRPAPCRVAQARAIRASVAGSATSAFVSVRPWTNPSTRTRSCGRYSITGAPTPAAAAMTELRYSRSRSMASKSPPSANTRATNTPAGVVTLKLVLVSPPGKALTSRGVPARLGSRASTAGGSAAARRGSVTIAH